MRLGFTLSCFGLILFLWIAFGGPIPLSPESYRFTAYFPEATRLATEADVRIGGVSVGKVKAIELAPRRVPRERQGRRRRGDRDRARVRTDLDRRAGDPAPEDGGRRDLRRDHVRNRAERRRGHPDRLGLSRRGGGSTRGRRARRRAAARRRDTRRSAHAGGGADRRDLQRPRRGDTPGVPALAAEFGGRDPRSQAGVERRARKPGPVHHGRERHPRDPGRSGGVAAWADSRRRDQLRGARLSSRRAHRGNPRPEEHLRGARRRGRGARRHLRDPAHVPARDPGHHGALGGLPPGRKPADPQDDPRRTRAQPDAAQRQEAVAESAQSLPRPRSALRRIPAGHAGAAGRTRRSRAR